MNMKIGIIGCGVISNTYIRDIKRLYKDLEIVAVADVNLEAAKECAKKYEISQALSVDELLDIPEIEMVVNLTPPAFHTEVSLKALEAGKHIFCEKPLALTMEDGKKVLDLAESKGLKFACAPDSFMGSSLSTCRKVLEDGWIGKPMYAITNMLSGGVETWHPRPEPFYKKGGGPIYDMGGYYFTTLVSMFGPVSSVRAVGLKGFEKRNVYVGERAGESFDVDVLTTYSILVSFKSGFMANMNFSFDVFKTQMPMFEIYGTEGTLFVPDPNMHGGTPKIYRRQQGLAKCYGGVSDHEDDIYELPEMFQNVGEYVRGIGVHDLALAITEGREPVASGKLALHVLDIMTSVMKSAETGDVVELSTTILI
ncbi:gfo/Idh/MocA family oxidoreductase [Butyrivibrio sp. CB08]|uniref:Gfo/Idh/MocA family protein n=1 Tax=Butyrivibrio sp. CB08 TaxID=2364879 RepID=UPI000EA88991|nr:Gfo/Idh/MocA family oxidoreductase [Butyrivibrio sp. CB08]RKM62200.1 gfo/Idh/MocA family oxidoreductase [Butyrivibrio sp. CB08]